MANYKFVNVMYQGKFPIHYGLMTMAELIKMEDPSRLAAILEEKHPGKIIAVDIYDSNIFQALPSSSDTYEIALHFLRTVSPYEFKGKWRDGEV